MQIPPIISLKYIAEILEKVHIRPKHNKTINKIPSKMAKQNKKLIRLTLTLKHITLTISYININQHTQDA